MDSCHDRRGRSRPGDRPDRMQGTRISCSASGKDGAGRRRRCSRRSSRASPHRRATENAPLQALIFDSVFNPFRGIIAYYRVFNGTIRKKGEARQVRGNTEERVRRRRGGCTEAERCSPATETPRRQTWATSCSRHQDLVGREGRRHDHLAWPTPMHGRPSHGFEDVKPMVFAGVYPVEADQYEDLRASHREVAAQRRLADVRARERQLALGFGFRCGFLGHAPHGDHPGAPLDREFDMDVITTVPNVSSYRVTTTQGDKWSRSTTRQRASRDHEDRLDYDRGALHRWRRSSPSRSSWATIIKLCH
jgi:GTP-binding protein LepA